MMVLVRVWRLLIGCVALLAVSFVHAQAPGNGTVLNSNALSVEFSHLTLRPGDPPVQKADVSLVYQFDGNLVLYKSVPGEPSRVLWDARVSRAGCASSSACQMRFTPGEGLVLLENGAEYWRANVVAPTRASKLWVSRVAPFLAIKSSDGAAMAGLNDPKSFGGQTLWVGMGRLNWLSVLDDLRTTSPIDPTGSPGWTGLYGSSRPGVTDFDTLFSNLGHWQNTAKNTHVFKFYSQPFAYFDRMSASEQQRLRNAISFLRNNHIAVALELPAVERTESQLAVCGRGVEGLAGSGYVQTVANNVKAAGGVVDFFSMDEPFYYSYYLGQNPGVIPPGASPCSYSPSELAAAAANAFSIVRDVFPGVVLGDTEPFDRVLPTHQAAYTQFLTALRSQIGAEIAFAHDDVSVLTPEWLSKMTPLWGYLNERQIPYGMIWNGSLEEPTIPINPSVWDVPISAEPERTNLVNVLKSTRWVAYAIGKTREYERLNALQGIQNVFQSWKAWPVTAGPETSPSSLTFLANYFFNRSIRTAEFAGSPLIYRFYHPQLKHSYGLGTTFGAGFALEGPAFRLLPAGSVNSAPARLCKINSSGRHFISSVNPPNTICEVAGTTAVSVLGNVALGMNRSAPEPLYRCRHILVNTYLTTNNPQECTLFPGSGDWAVDGVIGYGVPVN